jgi:hypothetical protein
MLLCQKCCDSLAVSERVLALAGINFKCRQLWRERYVSSKEPFDLDLRLAASDFPNVLEAVLK